MVDDSETSVQGDSDGHPIRVKLEWRTDKRRRTSQTQRSATVFPVARSFALDSLSLRDRVHRARQERAVQGDLLGHLGLKGDVRSLEGWTRWPRFMERVCV